MDDTDGGHRRPVGASRTSASTWPSTTSAPGYSSLRYLRRFPVDVLKVDQSFVDGLGPDPEDSAIVAAIVSLAHNLELEAIAEGVETRRAGSERSQALGCSRPGLPTSPKPVPTPTEIDRH